MSFHPFTRIHLHSLRYKCSRIIFIFREHNNFSCPRLTIFPIPGCLICFKTKGRPAQIKCLFLPLSYFYCVVRPIKKAPPPTRGGSGRKDGTQVRSEVPASRSEPPLRHILRQARIQSLAEGRLPRAALACDCVAVIGDPILPTFRCWRSTRAQCATHGQPGQSLEVRPRLTALPWHPRHPYPSTQAWAGRGLGEEEGHSHLSSPGTPAGFPAPVPDATRNPTRGAVQSQPEPRRTPGARHPAGTRSSANDPRAPSQNTATATLAHAAAPKLTCTPPRGLREPLRAGVACEEGAGE